MIISNLLRKLEKAKRESGPDADVRFEGYDETFPILDVKVEERTIGYNVGPGGYPKTKKKVILS